MTFSYCISFFFVLCHSIVGFPVFFFVFDGSPKFNGKIPPGHRWQRLKSQGNDRWEENTFLFLISSLVHFRVFLHALYIPPPPVLGRRHHNVGNYSSTLLPVPPSLLRIPGPSTTHGAPAPGPFPLPPSPRPAFHTPHPRTGRPPPCCRGKGKGWVDTGRLGFPPWTETDQIQSRRCRG